MSSLDAFTVSSYEQAKIGYARAKQSERGAAFAPNIEIRNFRCAEPASYSERNCSFEMQLKEIDQAPASWRQERRRYYKGFFGGWREIPDPVTKN